MRRELDEELCRHHPEIFRERHGDPALSAMPRGFQCGDGWFQLIDRLCAAIREEVAAGRMPPVITTQVKEKFGTLRFRIQDNGSEAAHRLIRAAEEESGRTCGICGCPGRLLVAPPRVRCPLHEGEKDCPAAK